MFNTWSLFLKTSENILKYTNFTSRNVILNFYKIDIYFSQKLSTIGYSSKLRQSNLTRLEKDIYEIFKLELLSGLFNAIKNNSFTKTTNR